MAELTTKRRRSVHKLLLVLAAMLLVTLSAACAQEPDPPIADLVPSEEEQILNTVEEYYISDHFALNEGNIPEYEAVVQDVVGQWARVAISPIGVETTEGPEIIYLQQSGDLVSTPTAEPASTEAANTERTEIIGWTIVAGPQARFSDQELDAAGVPEEIRP